MAANTRIEWADDTVNFWTGCTQVSPGCDYCYAMEIAKRFSIVAWNGPPKERGLRAAEELHASQRKAMKTGTRRFVFINSMADTFDNNAEHFWRMELFTEIRACPDIVALILTKRIGNVEKMMWPAPKGEPAWPANAWLGISVVNQAEADRDIPKLLAAKSRLKIPRAFLSVEPMLGSVILDRRHMDDDEIYWDFLRGSRGATTQHVAIPPEKTPRIDWVICGGESGAKARPMHPDWARSLRDQCAAAGVPFFFKQWGEHAIIYDREREDPDWRRCDVVHREHPRGQWLNVAGGQGFHGDRVVYAEKVGKARAGRLLDGVEHNARPQPDESTGRKGEALATRSTSPGSPA